ncbi:hypothetical protein ACFX2I_035745 [Malus domestica]
MGYNALSSVPRGEICLSGATLYSGYHKREDLPGMFLLMGGFIKVYSCQDATTDQQFWVKAKASSAHEVLVLISD